MAAHILVGMNDLINQKVTVDQFLHAMSYAQMGDNMDVGDWSLLQEIGVGRPELFVEFVRLVRPLYETLWQRLGKPHCAEEWSRVRWSDQHKVFSAWYNQASTPIVVPFLNEHLPSQYDLRKVR